MYLSHNHYKITLCSVRALKQCRSSLLHVRPKCKLAASHAALWWVTVTIPKRQTDA